MDRPDGAARAGELRTRSAEETYELGRRLGDAAVAGTLLALVGPLGAGKTQLTKGVADGLGVTSVVNSPTFILMNEHAARLRLYHIDAYRLDEGTDPMAAGLLDDRQASGVTVVEWADRIADWLPAERLEIEIEPMATEPMHRTVRWRAFGQTHATLGARALADALPSPAGSPR
jgi:tRNA threonylcarbamoyladenosine biosynthesis protein TsaE